MLTKLLFVAVTGLIAIYAMDVCKDQGFQPTNRLRVILFCTGALAFFCVIWLAIPGSFWYMLWLKLLGGLAGGYNWAYVMPKRLQS